MGAIKAERIAFLSIVGFFVELIAFNMMEMTVIKLFFKFGG